SCPPAPTTANFTVSPRLDPAGRPLKGTRGGRERCGPQDRPAGLVLPLLDREPQFFPPLEGGLGAVAAALEEGVVGGALMPGHDVELHVQRRVLDGELAVLVRAGRVRGVEGPAGRGHPEVDAALEADGGSQICLEGVLVRPTLVQYDIVAFPLDR